MLLRNSRFTLYGRANQRHKASKHSESNRTNIVSICFLNCKIFQATNKSQDEGKAVSTNTFKK